MPRLFLALACAAACLTGCFDNSSSSEEGQVFVPLYSNASVFKTIGTSESDHYEQYLSTPDPADKIREWYLEQFSREQWKVQTSGGFGMLAVITAQKSRRTVGIQIFEQSGRRVIHQTLKKKKQRSLW